MTLQRHPERPHVDTHGFTAVGKCQRKIKSHTVIQTHTDQQHPITESYRNNLWRHSRCPWSVRHTQRRRAESWRLRKNGFVNRGIQLREGGFANSAQRAKRTSPCDARVNCNNGTSFLPKLQVPTQAESWLITDTECFCRSVRFSSKLTWNWFFLFFPPVS